MPNFPVAPELPNQVTVNLFVGGSYFLVYYYSEVSINIGALSMLKLFKVHCKIIFGFTFDIHVK